jgi:alpha-L-fucosidase 2
MNDIGWSTTWKGAMFARLRRGDRAFGMLNNYVSGAINKSFRNITDIPPLGGPVFQVDATFAYTAALSEMLIQSHEETVSLLPAIPSRWDHGSFRGLRARGGFEVDASWSGGCVSSFSVRSDKASSCLIELPSKQSDARFTDENGNVYTAKDSVISLPSFENITLTLT